jgi:serine/threonine protein kinase
MRVLAADDDPLLARMLERCLRNWGYEAVIASDGAEAWQALKGEDAPNVVILDWDMPGLSGVEICRLLRATPRGARSYVLMLTGREQKADLIEALECGADDFLSKPFHPRELQLRLAKGVRDIAQPGRSQSGAPPTGTTLGGKYRLERKIAQGGMATVWAGAHLSLGINVAIKFMAPGLAELTDYASFEREARAAAQLRSEHAMRVYDHGITGDGLPYLVMEYLGGESLAARVERSGPLALAEVVVLVDQASRALTEAHARGLVHRDVKPENLILEDSDRPPGFSAKLIDFGLAKPWKGQVTKDAQLAGTPSYMSPEYLTGDALASPLLDLWGLAATAFVALTGVVPFDAATLTELVRRVCMEPPPIPSRARSDLPSGVDAWFALACAHDPGTRYQTAQELASALAGVCKGVAEPISRPRGQPIFAPTEPDTLGGARRS